METTLSAEEVVDEIGRAIGVEGERKRGWFERVVHRRMKRSLAKAHSKRKAGAYDDAVPSERARSITRWACAKAGLTGAIAGSISTTATVLTAETEGLALIITLPIAALAIGGEMLVRAVVHVDLACELAELFDLKFDDHDVSRLFTLVFAASKAKEENGDDLGKGLVGALSEERGELAEHAGKVVVGESVLRNLVPFVAIASSAITNIVVTHRMGQTLRRTFRYERAMLDALKDAELSCAPVMDLVVEGLWYIFTADGHLTPEESACLAHRLDDMPLEARRSAVARFSADELDWMERINAVPADAREAFFHVLEVAAALDKSIDLPETKILRRVAHRFLLEYDPARVRKMIDSLELTGRVT